MKLHSIFLTGATLGLGLAVATGAMAVEADHSTSQQSVDVGGHVANLCILGTPSQGSIDVGQLANTSTSRVGKIVSVGNQVVTLPNSFCNFAGTQLTITSVALLAADTSPVQTGFSRSVNFASTVTTWAPSAPSVTTAASAGGNTATATGSGGTQTTPKLTDLTLTLSNFATGGGDLLLVAGAYSGSVTITLGPAAGGGE